VDDILYNIVARPQQFGAIAVKRITPGTTHSH
jgi:hypothetical protein